MKTLKIYGYSDDLIEAEGISGAEEFEVDFGRTLPTELFVDSEDAIIVIYAIYNGYWCFAVSPGKGDGTESMPDWKITRSWGTEEGYSETLEIECPDDAVLRRG